MPSVLPAQAVRQRARPVAAPHALGLQRHVAPRRHDQRNGEFGRRIRRIALSGGHRDSERGAGGKIDGAGVAPDQGQQFEPGEALQQRAREIHPLTNGDHDIGIAQPLDQLVEVARRRAVARHVMLRDERMAGELVDHVLIVVGNYDFHERRFLLFSLPDFGEGRGGVAASTTLMRARTPILPCPKSGRSPGGKVHFACRCESQPGLQRFFD
jgi:hypothetical protein